MDGVSFKGTYTLGHELYHGYQRDLGVAGYDAPTRVKGQDGILPLGEIQAVGFENYLRAKFNEVGFNNARETYTSKFLSISTPVKIKEFTTMGGWPSIGLGWTTPWNVTDFVNKKATWINLREVALKKHTSN